MHRPMVVTIMAICTQQRPETDFPCEGRGYGQLARARLLEMNFPKSPLVERRPGFSLEKNGFTRVNMDSERRAGFLV